MNNEIKKILEKPNIYDFNDECYLYFGDYNKLKDYITNLQKIEKDHQKLNGELREENKRLKKTIVIMEKYLELIHDLGYDYDGLNYEHDLKGLIDDMVRFASLGRACNTTKEIYVDGKGKSLNILGEELKENK